MMRNDFMNEYQKVMKESLNVFLNEQNDFNSNDKFDIKRGGALN